MNKSHTIKSTILWTIWAALLFYYFNLPYTILGEIPYEPKINEFEWDWVMTFSMFHLPFIALMWIVARKKRNSKKMLGYFIAGIAIAEAHCNYSAFLVSKEGSINQTIIWFIGLMGMISFCPIFFTPQSAKKTVERNAEPLSSLSIPPSDVHR